MEEFELLFGGSSYTDDELYYYIYIFREEDTVRRGRPRSNAIDFSIGITQDAEEQKKVAL